ncbi:hypothetical protein [Anderseniella sp. Alg231-50]|uniref:hypothetical protein n=1 Tax=Anderseniella sp. Alg231-50 TaxID=1922226 RepID=UPI000D54FABA
MSEEKQRTTAIIACLLLIPSIVILFFKIETSFLKMCLNVFGDKCISSDKYSKKLVELATSESGWDNAAASIAGGAELFLIAITAALVGFLIALIAAILFPNGIQLTGELEKFGGHVKFGGFAALFLLFSGGGYMLAWQGIPAATTAEVNETAFRALAQAHKTLSQEYAEDMNEMQEDISNKYKQLDGKFTTTYNGLSESYVGFGENQTKFVEHISKYEEKILFKLLNNGFFGKLHTTIKVNCTKDNVAQRNELALVTRSETKATLPVKVVVKMEPKEINKPMATIYLAERNNIDDQLGDAREPLVVIQYIPIETKAIGNQRIDRSVDFVARINQFHINSYCNSEYQSVEADVFE